MTVLTIVLQEVGNLGGTYELPCIIIIIITNLFLVDKIKIVDTITLLFFNIASYFDLTEW
jgi:hypothetical protein